MNEIAHSFDDQQPDKKERALALIADALHTGNGMASRQVLQEFLNAAMRIVNPYRQDN